MTLDELRTQARVFLQDPSGTRWGDPELDQWLNDGQDDFATRTRCLRTAANLTAHATLDTPQYAFWQLASNCISLERLEVDGEEVCHIPLASFSPQLDWATQTGEARLYLHGEWGFDVVRLYPVPTSNPTVKAYYVKRAEVMAASDDTPEIPVLHHMALVYFAVARAYFKDQQAKAPENALPYQQMYEQQVALCSQNLPSTADAVPYRHL